MHKGAASQPPFAKTSGSSARWWPLVVVLCGCPVVGDEKPKTKTPEDFGDPTTGTPVAVGPAIERDHSNDPPEVSRSRGQRGGVVVLWPRVAPSGDTPAAHEIA